MSGNFNGKKRPGRPRTSYLTSLKKWLDPTASENTIIRANASRWDGATWSPTPSAGARKLMMTTNCLAYFLTLLTLSN